MSIILNYFGQKDKMLKIKYTNLLALLTLFKDRPNHLTQFIIENDALNSNFIKRINSSDKLNELSNGDIKKLYFNNINEMKKFYVDIIDDLEDIKKRKTKEQLVVELEKKIILAISNENYEEAARIRDYMIKNNLKKNKLND